MQIKSTSLFSQNRSCQLAYVGVDKAVQAVNSSVDAACDTEEISFQLKKQSLSIVKNSSCFNLS